MKQGRWIAVAVCSFLIAFGTGMLYVALSRPDALPASIVRFFPYGALLLIAVVPLVAAAISGSATWFAAGGGGLAVGIAVAVLAAALNNGGNGVLPLTLGIAIGGVIALRAENHVAIWMRLAVTVLLAVYAIASGRLAALAFVYPLLAFADEFADVIAGRRRRAERSPREEVPAPRS